MAAEGRKFKGVLYAGLMLTAAGPELIEYNTRFGDPECQVLMMRLKSDILPALIAARDGTLKDFDLRWRDETALCVVLAGIALCGEPLKGTEISGLAQAANGEAVKIFHAGTRRSGDKILADGGRVLGVTALGKDAAEAQAKAYAAVDRVDWKEGFCRRDIGWRALRRGC
jgi:phosphoribosylamine--glycine ligase